MLTSKDAPREAVAIAQAVERLVERIGEVLARERAFAETVSHELRTPLSAVQSTIERLLALPDLGDPCAGASSAWREASERCGRPWRCS